MIQIIKSEPKFDFIGKQTFAFIFSPILIGIGIFTVILHGGLNYGIDFSGGTLIQARFDQPTSAVEIKKGLESLEKAAHALDCRLVYALVPRKPLETLAQERAIKLAQRRLSKTSHSMALEDQGVDAADEQEQIRQLAQHLLEKSGSKLWEDE